MKKIISLILSVLMLFGMAICPVYAVNPAATVEICKVSALPGDRVEVFINLKCNNGIKTLSFIDFSYDDSVLMLVESECVWLTDGIIKDIDFENNASIITFGENTTFNCDVFKLVFEVSEYAQIGSVTVSCDAIITSMIDNVETVIDVSIINGEVEIVDSTANLDDFEYELTDDGIVITGYKGNKANVVISESYDIDGSTYNVVEIAESAFEANEDIKSVVIPDTVKVIGDYAFYDCTSLTKVTIFSRDVEIGEAALGYYYISRREDGVVEGFTIHAYEGSTAEEYTDAESEMTFVALEEPDCNHEGGTYIKNAVEATCTTEGYTGDTYCKSCDVKLETGEKIDILDHTPAEAVTENRVEPKCEIKGSYDEVVYCSACKAEISRKAKEIPALKHNWDNGVIDPVSTCKTHGVKTYTCQNDTTHKRSEQVALDGNNHEGETEIRNAVEANCGEAGYTGDTYCLGCNTKIADGKEIPATGRHNYVGTVTKVATCKSTGVKTYTCSVCGDTYTDVIPVDSTNHEGGTEIRNAVEGNCGEAGYTGDTYCLGCNTKIADGEETPATGRHNYVGTVTKAATCKSTGVKTYTCSVCGDTYTDVIPVDSTNHEGGTEIRNAVEGNCGEAGYTGDTYCLGCNTKIADGKEIPATGHDWDEGVISPVSTCKTHGTKTYTCQNDTTHQYTEEVALDSNNHEGETYIKDNADATCTVDGYTGDTYCSGCDEKIADGEVIPATGHKWNAGVINPVSTCKTHGTKTYTCQNDATHQYSEQVALDSNNHEGDTYIKDDADATCTVDGYTGDTYCSGCDEKIADGEVIPAVGYHTYGNWTVNAEDDKKMSRTCTVCGDVEESAVYLAGRSLLFKDIIQMRYYFDFSKFGDDVTETGLLIWTEDEYAEADEHNISTAPYKTTNLAQNSKGYYYGDSAGIPAKNMIDKQIAIAYAVLSDGTIEYTEECVFSPVMYSQIILAEGSTSKATMKTLAASLMNYGAAAQNFFNYKTETPMNAWMSDELKAVGFDTSLIQALPEIDNNKLEGCNDDTVTKRGSSLTFVGNINQNIYFDIKDDVVTDAKVLYWTESEYKKLDKLTTANAHTADLVYDAANSASLKINCYRSVFEGVAAKDLRDAFVFAVYYKDAEGNEHYSTLFADGAHDYVRRVVTGSSKQTMKDLAKAFLMYHLAAEDHLLG